MSIAKNLSQRKSGITTCSNTPSLGIGNIIPHWWYKEIRAGGNKPDLVAITILSKLFALKTKYINSNISTNNDQSSSDNGDEDIFHNEVLGNSSFASSENSSEHISNRKRPLRKNRSNESSIFKNSFKSLAQNKSDLASFYPLFQSDIVLLQRNSGREFTLTAVNEILLKLAKKHTSHRFPNKTAFLSYMTKVLMHEKRDAVKISNPNFRLNYNQDLEAEAKHRFPEEIEYSRDTDNRKITFKAPSSFMKDWVQTKYSLLLERCFQLQNYSSVGMV